MMTHDRCAPRSAVHAARTLQSGATRRHERLTARERSVTERSGGVSRSLARDRSSGYDREVVGEPATRPAVSETEYLASERAAPDEKHELWRGEVFAMAGASWAHNVITANLTTALNTLVRSRGCRAVSQDMKVRVPWRSGFVYPDVVVVCGEPQFLDAQEDVLLNPSLVIEVLSPTTERFDRGEKANGYRSLESVRELLLVAQDERRVEHYERMTDGAWLLRVVDGAQVLRLPGLGVEIPLNEIYEGVAARVDSRG